MGEHTFPFPERKLADVELSYDLSYGKIPPEDRARIVDSAWTKGESIARTIFEQFNGQSDFFVIAQESDLTVLEKDIDYIAGNQRYFSDYISGQKTINLYLKSIDLWAEQNELSRSEAENLILSHEFFHFLEWTTYGLTSRDYQVPMLCIGKLKLGKTGVRALSEIGAHAFARTYHDLLRKDNKDANITL